MKNDTQEMSDSVQSPKTVKRVKHTNKYRLEQFHLPEGSETNIEWYDKNEMEPLFIEGEESEMGENTILNENPINELFMSFAVSEDAQEMVNKSIKRKDKAIRKRAKEIGNKKLLKNTSKEIQKLKQKNSERISQVQEAYRLRNEIEEISIEKSTIAKKNEEMESLIRNKIRQENKQDTIESCKIVHKSISRPARIMPIKDSEERKLYTIDQLEKEKEKERFLLNIANAKQWIKENKTTVANDMNNMVALYNIGKQEAFYFITPVEARRAIQYITDLRENNLNEFMFEHKKEQDCLFILLLQSLKLNEHQPINIEKINKILDFAIEDIVHPKELSTKITCNEDAEKPKKINIFKSEIPINNKYILSDIYERIQGNLEIGLDFIAAHPENPIFNYIILNKDVSRREKENKVRVLGEIDLMEIYSHNSIKKNEIIACNVLSDGRLIAFMFNII